MSCKTLEIASKVPYGTRIYWWLHMASDQPADALIRESGQFERHYLAWETVRNGQNPYFENGTGFEGYLVGCCQSSAEALERILGFSRDMLNSVTRLHKFEYQYRTRLFRTLRGELEDPAAMSEWAAEFGATLARLRCNVLGNRQVETFQSATYQHVYTLPPISYIPNGCCMKQLYKLEIADVVDGAKSYVDARALNGPEQDAWLLAQSIGKFGHPLVREYLRFGRN